MPSDHRDWNALAWTYLQSGQSELALEAARRAHEGNRNNLGYLNTLRVAYGEIGELERAEAAFRKVLKRKPGSLDAVLNLAKALEKQERLPEALKLYERALAMEPAYPKLATNLARLYRECGGNAARALALLERSARHIAGEDLALALASCDLELAGVDAAASRLSRALADHPDWVLARKALAHMLLAAGRWREGWQEYRWRGARHGAPMLNAPLPARLDGERILLRGEQGLGDVLFFLRFAPLLRARGGVVALACETKLHSILRQGGGLQAVRALPPQDAGFLVGDLPALLECSETPPAWPLSVADDERRGARARLGALGPAPYLAVTWRAGTDAVRAREFGEDRMSLMKAVPAAELGNAVRGWRGTAILLQRGARNGELAQFAEAFGALAHDLSFLGNDLAALLAVLAELDEYATVSNTNVHLLAGLGRSARVLVPYPA
ncbi:MAG TPA: tetratricopeptide repeat protein, partial [Burkholderiales bacterium]